MRRIDRYVLTETFAPTLVGFLAYTGFMLIRGLFQFSLLILQSPSPLADTIDVLALSIPHIVVLTIPVSFLLGVLVGVGRLSSDSELTAIRAAGIDLFALYRPIGLLATFLAGLTVYVMLALVPAANALLSAKKLELSTFVIAQRIQPGVFSPEFGGRRIYVDAASPDGRRLERLVVSDRSNPQTGERLIIARAGTLEIESDEGRLWLRLEDASTQRVWDSGASDERASYREQRILLAETDPPSAGSPGLKQLREMTILQLLQRSRVSQSPVEVRTAWLEIHKKFALPAACLLFGFIGLPLGIVNRRGGRSAGFAISVVLVLFYYIVLAFGEAKAIDGKWTPFTAMWLPNGLLTLFGIFAIQRVQRHKPLFPQMGLPRFLSRFQSPDRPSTPSSRTQQARRDLLGSSFLLDRYVLRRFMGVFGIVLLSILVLYVVIEILEIADDIAKNQPGTHIVLRYLQAILPPILQDVIPYAFLIAALIALAGMVKSAETTAILSHGISLHRVVLPLLVIAAGTGVFLYFFSERIVPKSGEEAERLRNRIVNRVPFAGASNSSLWFRGEQGRFFAVDAMDLPSSRIANLTVLELDPASLRPVRRFDAEDARVLPQRGFLVSSAWVRHFDESGSVIKGKQDRPLLINAPEALTVLATARTNPRTMTSQELVRFIKARKKAGADTAALATGLYQKSAIAFSPLLLTLLGVPFAFRYGKRGAVAGVGAALLVGLAYLAFSSITFRFGTTGALEPILAAWGANVFFGLLSLYGMLGIRT